MNIDLDALTLAFNDNSLERSYYLDRATGRVFNLLEDHDDPETEEIAWQIEADGGRRFIQVPKLTIEQVMQEQDAFVDCLEDADLRTKLAKVLESDRDGRGFEDFVSRHRDARERWRFFGRARARERADQWLRSLGIPAT